jgi:hypothetical protein
MMARCPSGRSHFRRCLFSRDTIVGGVLLAFELNTSWHAAYVNEAEEGKRGDCWDVDDGGCESEVYFWMIPRLVGTLAPE